MNPRLKPRRRPFASALLLTLVASVSGAFCQPKLATPEATSYQVGARVSTDVFVLDAEMNPRPLSELVQPEDKVVVLIIFGADFKTSPDEPRRGPFWCEDSFDDLPIQRALYHEFKNQPVRFIPVAVPPVYAPDRFGWEDNVFLDQPDDSEAYREAARSFIELTEREVKSGLIPFPQVYYDPKFRLAQNKKERELGPGFGKVYDWQGKLKWSQDPRKYGTPTIWILGRDGEVLTEPLFGNDYDSDPPEIHYGFQDAKELIEKCLER